MKQLLLLFLGCVLPIFSNESQTDARTKIESLVSGAISKQKIPGLSIAVVDKGQILYSGAFGEADLENHVRVTERSRFRTASVAKPITATATLVLASDGRLNLDAPIQNCGRSHPVNYGWVLLTSGSSSVSDL